MKLNRRGLIATIVYHTLLILLLVFAGLTFPDPPPEEEGILVNFGTDETGLGDFEPVGDDQQADESEQSVVEETPEYVEEIPEPVQEEIVETVAPPDPSPVDNTQDVEEVLVKEDPKPTAEELEKEQIEREKKERIEREERIAREEQERIEREEREAREEQERIKKEQDAKAAKLSTAGRDAFKPGVGETEGGEGITEGDGNQGVTTGEPDADEYGTGGGLGNNDDSYGLGTRKVVGNLTEPDLSNCNVTSKIVITVSIQVDREGKVVSANIKEATFTDACIDQMVKTAALNSRFSRDPNANYRQTGWIRYTILP